jgi:hypothetical protein
MQNETKNTEIKNTALALLCAVTYSALPYHATRWFLLYEWGDWL